MTIKWFHSDIQPTTLSIIGIIISTAVLLTTSIIECLESPSTITSKHSPGGKGLQKFMPWPSWKWQHGQRLASGICLSHYTGFHNFFLKQHWHLEIAPLTVSELCFSYSLMVFVHKLDCTMLQWLTYSNHVAPKNQVLTSIDCELLSHSAIHLQHSWIHLSNMVSCEIIPLISTYHTNYSL